ncbi:MAG: nucleotide exchange factor GrpE [Candidatus Dojkabacteria bacterium]|jgi:molecular chaperone GrpE
MSNTIKKKQKDISQRNKEEELEKKIRELALTIDEVEDEKLVVENQLKKALADYHNLLKNSEKRDEMRFFQVKRKLFEDLIPSLDAVRMAIKTGEEIKFEEKSESWKEGVIAVLEKINKSMEEIGLQQYVPVKGDSFDNEIHEAIATVEEGEKGKIYDVVQPGYILDEMVIRPARVVVSK